MASKTPPGPRGATDNEIPDHEILAMIRAKLQKLIETGNWQVTHTFSQHDDPVPNVPFSYTTGLTELFGHPELIMTGIPPETAHALLNNAGRLVKNGQRFNDGAVATKILADDYPVAFRELTIENRAGHAKICDDRYGTAGYYALQIFIPDPQRRFPWTPNCEQQYITLQCRLFGVGLEPPPKIDYAGIARADGARLLTGLGQYRAGRGSYVTKWTNSENDAWRDYCHLAGLVTPKSS